MRQCVSDVIRRSATTLAEAKVTERQSSRECPDSRGKDVMAECCNSQFGEYKAPAHEEYQSYVREQVVRHCDSPGRTLRRKMNELSPQGEFIVNLLLFLRRLLVHVPLHTFLHPLLVGSFQLPQLCFLVGC